MSLSLISASNGSGEAVRASVTAVRNIGSVSIAVDSIINWPNKFIATSGTLKSDNTLDPATISVFTGHISSGAISIDSFAPGYSDKGNAVGDVVVVKPTTAWADNISSTLAVSLSDDGTINSAGLTQVTTSLSGQQIRLKPRISTTTSIATLAPNIDNYNIYELNAQSTNLTIANPTGTPNDGDVLLLRIKDNGTSQSITYGTQYVNVSGLSTLTATTAGKWHYIGIQYNAGATAWHVISITTGA